MVDCFTALTTIDSLNQVAKLNRAQCNVLHAYHAFEVLVSKQRAAENRRCAQSCCPSHSAALQVEILILPVLVQTQAVLLLRLSGPALRQLYTPS